MCEITGYNFEDSFVDVSPSGVTRRPTLGVSDTDMGSRDTFFRQSEGNLIDADSIED